MQQPPRYVDPVHPNIVYKLKKSLYGLKQVPRAWFEKFTFHLLHLGFTTSLADSSFSFSIKDYNHLPYIIYE